jgi:hypothetical protein
MAPLASEQPFATHEPDFIYETPRAPQPHIRQPAFPNPNSRTSAYDVYVMNVAMGKKFKLTNILFYPAMTIILQKTCSFQLQLRDWGSGNGPPEHGR